MLLKWENLDESLQCEAVKKYYDILSKKKGSLFIKRMFDIVVSFIMIILLSPILIFISIWIKIDSPGTVFYRQVRVTKNNKDFRIFKFRTMVSNADKIGSLVTVGQDNRITKVGNKLRKLRLDELPQLFNILKGEMSFVGTRPEVRKYVDVYKDEMKATLLMPAGVTSLASIKFKDEDEIISKHVEEGYSVDEAYINFALSKKMEYNLESLKDFSFIKEIGLMFKTVFEVLK